MFLTVPMINVLLETIAAQYQVVCSMMEANPGIDPLYCEAGKTLRFPYRSDAVRKVVINLAGIAPLLLSPRER